LLVCFEQEHADSVCLAIDTDDEAVEVTSRVGPPTWTRRS
jgi:hypothetical protein